MTELNFQIHVRDTVPEIYETLLTVFLLELTLILKVSQAPSCTTLNV